MIRRGHRKWMRIHKKRFKNFVKQQLLGKTIKINEIKADHYKELEKFDGAIDGETILYFLTNAYHSHHKNQLNYRKIYYTKYGLRISGDGLILYLDENVFMPLIDEIKIKGIINKL